MHDGDQADAWKPTAEERSSLPPLHGPARRTSPVSSARLRWEQKRARASSFPPAAGPSQLGSGTRGPGLNKRELRARSRGLLSPPPHPASAWVSSGAATSSASLCCRGPGSKVTCGPGFPGLSSDGLRRPRPAPSHGNDNAPETGLCSPLAAEPTSRAASLSPARRRRPRGRCPGHCGRGEARPAGRRPPRAGAQRAGPAPPPAPHPGTRPLRDGPREEPRASGFPTESGGRVFPERAQLPSPR